MENTSQDIQKKTTLKERLTRLNKIGKRAVLITRIGLATAVAGTGAYVYKQFHKSPEQIKKETQVMADRVEKKVPEYVHEVTGTTNQVTEAVGKAGGKIAGWSAQLGGLARRKLAERNQTDK